MNKVNFYRPPNVGGLIEFQFTEMIDNTTMIILEGKMYDTGRVETAKLSLVHPSFHGDNNELVPCDSFSIYGWDHICNFLSHFSYAGKTIQEFINLKGDPEAMAPWFNERRRSSL